METSLISVRKAFEKYDSDHSGNINACELEDLCDELGASLTNDQLKEALEKLDVDDNGLIDFQEFKNWWTGQVDAADIGKDLVELAKKGRAENYEDIFTACWKGDLEVVKEFLEMDSTLASRVDETEFGEGYTPLHYAAYQGHRDICELLVKYKTNVNSRNSAGCTPLFLASQQGHISIVKHLLQHGAKMISTKNGYSPIDVASSNDPINELLLQNCDTTSLPKELDRPPIAECQNFGTLRLSWSYKAKENSGFIVQVIRAHENIDSDSSSSSESEEEEEEGGGGGKRSGRIIAGTVLLETKIRGPDTREIEIPNIKYPFMVAAKVAAYNASGNKSEWSEPSGPVLCSGVPTITSPPTAILVKNNSVKVTWKKPNSNGSKVIAYRLEVCEQEDCEWERAMNPFRATTREVTIDNLSPGRTYMFRLVCSNKLGKSKPGPPSKPIKTNGARRHQRTRK